MKKLRARTRIALGYVSGCSEFLNKPDRLERLEQQVFQKKTLESSMKEGEAAEIARNKKVEIAKVLSVMSQTERHSQSAQGYSSN